MQRHHRKSKHNGIAAAILLGGLAFSPWANAGYTVMHDDLYPTAMVEARQAQTQSANFAMKTEYAIPFLKNRLTPTKEGQQQLADLALNVGTNATIEITGYSDAQPYMEGRNEPDPQLRANNLRDYLVGKGVSPRQIVINVENRPSSKARRGIFPSEIHISYERSGYVSQKYAEYQARHQERLGNVGNYESPAALPNAELIRTINQAVSDGLMNPAVAAQIMASATAASYMPPQPSPQSQFNPQASSHSSNNMLKASWNESSVQQGNHQQVNPRQALLPMPSDWEILLDDGTLQNTINRWAALANWDVKWQDIPNIKNISYAKLSNKDFIGAADYVLNYVKLLANNSGIKISVTAYTNNVLIISKVVN